MTDVTPRVYEHTDTHAHRETKREGDDDVADANSDAVDAVVPRRSRTASRPNAM
jgi:hypothetical protein